MAGMKKGSESDQKLFLLIKTAIEREVASQKIYQEALDHCSDPMLRQVIEKLLAEEVMHEKKLQAMYKKLRRSYDADGNPIAG